MPATTSEVLQVPVRSSVGHADEVKSNMLFKYAHDDNAPEFKKLVQTLKKNNLLLDNLLKRDPKGQNILLVTMKNVDMFRVACEELYQCDKKQFILMLADAGNEYQENLMHQFVEFGRVKTLKFLFEFISALEDRAYKQLALHALQVSLWALNNCRETPLHILTPRHESASLKSLATDANWPTKVKPYLDKNLEEMRRLPFLISFFITPLFTDLTQKVRNLGLPSNDALNHLSYFGELVCDLSAREPSSPEVASLVSTLYTLTENLIQIESLTKIQFDKYKKSCEAAMERAEKKLRQHPGVWLNVHPIIRGILGVLAALAVLPLLVVAAVGVAKDKNYVRTFFNTPQVAQERVDAAAQIVEMRFLFSTPG